MEHGATISHYRWHSLLGQVLLQQGLPEEGLSEIEKECHANLTKVKL